MAAASQGPSVEAVLELAAVLRFPRFDGHPELLLDPVPIPLWDDVEGAEGNDAEVGSQVVDVASYILESRRPAYVSQEELKMVTSSSEDF